MCFRSLVFSMIKDGAVPAWDGQPKGWRRYCREVCWFVQSTNVNQRRHLATHLIARLSGSARLLAMSWPQSEFDHERGVLTYLQRLAESPLVRRSLTNAAATMTQYFGFKRMPKESISSFLVRETLSYEGFQEALSRLHEERAGLDPADQDFGLEAVFQRSDDWQWHHRWYPEQSDVGTTPMHRTPAGKPTRPRTEFVSSDIRAWWWLSRSFIPEAWFPRLWTDICRGVGVCYKQPLWARMSRMTFCHRLATSLTLRVSRMLSKSCGMSSSCSHGPWTIKPLVRHHINWIGWMMIRHGLMTTGGMMTRGKMLSGFGVVQMTGLNRPILIKRSPMSLLQQSLKTHSCKKRCGRRRLPSLWQLKRSWLGRKRRKQQLHWEKTGVLVRLLVGSQHLVASFVVSPHI